MITIHCGLHKTGSSSIQLGLQLSGASRRPVVIPQPGESQSDEAWAARINALPSDAILSNENLLGSPFDGYSRAPARVRILDESLKGREYQVIVYLRAQLPWLQSVYLQGVQQGRNDSPETFVTRVTASPFVCWNTLLELLRGSDATNIIVRAYESRRDVVNDFFAQTALGTPPNVGAMGLRENPSITAVQAPILRALNSHANAAESQRHRELFQGPLREHSPSGLSPFPVAMQQATLRRYHDDWSAVCSSVRFADDAEAAVFTKILQGWDESAAPFAGESITDPLIAAEMIRSIRIMEVETKSRPSALGRRIMRAIEDPTLAIAAMRRRVFGRSR